MLYLSAIRFTKARAVRTATKSHQGERSFCFFIGVCFKVWELRAVSLRLSHFLSSWVLEDGEVRPKDNGSGFLCPLVGHYPDDDGGKHNYGYEC